MQPTLAPIPATPPRVPHTRSWGMWVLALLVAVTGVAPTGQSLAQTKGTVPSDARPADSLAAPGSPQGGAANRITVHVAGLHAGTVEIDVDPSLLPELPYDSDGAVIMPTNFCGLRITHVGAFHWDDGAGNLIEAENHGEVTVQGNGYYLGDEDITEYYLGGVAFTGGIPTCDENAPWFFPIPLSYGGQGPRFGAARLFLELDWHSAPTIEFLKEINGPMPPLPDLYADWEPPPGEEVVCEEFPELCEPAPRDPGRDPDPPEDPAPPDGMDDLTAPLPGGDPLPFGLQSGAH